MTTPKATTAGMIKVLNVRNKRVGEAELTTDNMMTVIFDDDNSQVKISLDSFKKWYQILDDARSDEDKAERPAETLAPTVGADGKVNPAKKPEPTAEEIAAKAAEKAKKDQDKADAKSKKDQEKADAKAKKDAEKAAEKAKKDAEKAAKQAEKDAAKAAKASGTSSSKKNFKCDCDKNPECPKCKGTGLVAIVTETEDYTKTVEQGRDENYVITTLKGKTADWQLISETKNNVFWSRKLVVNGDKQKPKVDGVKMHNTAEKVMKIILEKTGVAVKIESLS